jgi:hypothetical protein
MLMRFLILTASLLAALAFVSGAPAAANATKTTTIQANITGIGCGSTGTVCGGTCCLLFWNFFGRANISPPLGSLRFTASYDEGGDPFSDPATGRRDLVLTLVSGNGDQLVLDEHATWLATDPVPPPTWTVDQRLSTGRFAGYTGSGVYSLDIGVSEDGTFGTFALALTGTLTSAR